jgi:acyl-CoA thioester hydrolase
MKESVVDPDQSDPFSAGLENPSWFRPVRVWSKGMKYFQTTYRVIYGDVDAMKVAYYGNYLRWFEIGRTELIRHLGLPYAEIEAQGFLLPVTEAYCKYGKSARYDDVLFINTGINFVRKASMRFDYRILNQENDLLVQGYTVHACLDKTGKLVRLPEILFRVLEHWT